MHRIALDIGGTKIESMLCGQNPLDVMEKKRIPCQKDLDYRSFVEQVAQVIEGYSKPVEQEAMVIGIGMPGSICYHSGIVRNSSILSLNGKPFQQDLEQRLQWAVHIENDANCMALSEAHFGAAQEATVVAGVIIGTGLGGGIVIDKKLRAGKNGYAAEFGHVGLTFGGRSCWCGQKGCAEQYISGTSLERQYKEASGKAKKVSDIYQCYLDKEETATQVLNQYLQYFAQALANIIYTMDPDVIVIGGGVSQLPLLYTEGVNNLQRHFQEELHTSIVASKMGDSSGIYGAALLPDF